MTCAVKHRRRHLGEDAVAEQSLRVPQTLQHARVHRCLRGVREMLLKKKTDAPKTAFPRIGLLGHVCCAAGGGAEWHS